MAIFAVSRSSMRNLRRKHLAQIASRLRLQLGISLRLRSLPLQRIHLARDFLQNVEHARQVLLGAFEFRLRQPLASFEFRDSGRFFDHVPAVLRLIAQNLSDAPLLDDRVAFRAQSRPKKEVLNIAQAGPTCR